MDTSDPHLDAERLAAWVDGGLSGAELRMVESHVADCARCQSLVGAMARTSAAVPAPEPERATRRWLAWAVPLTAAATALVIWTTVPRNSSTPATPTNQVVPATQPAREPPEVISSPEIIPEKEEPLEKKAAPPAPAPAQAAESRDQFAPNTETNASALQARNDTADVPVAAPSAAAPTAPRTALAAPAAARTLSATTARPAPNMQALCGATWTGPAPAVTTPVTAGSAPSANVCWIVGRLGVVLLTTDGRTWRGITFAAITDLSSVTATDARNATVVTADGRSFTTTDGGMTWKAGSGQ